MKAIKFLFHKKMDDRKIMDALGRSVYIRNGIGYGFISDEYLYDNAFIEIGFGRSRSGRGDWGGGCDYAETTPLKVVIDKDFIIHKITTDSFYNSAESRQAENVAKRLAAKLSIGNKLSVVDDELKEHISTILDFIPCKSHIGHDVFSSPHMLKHFTDPKDKNRYSALRDPINPETKNEER